MEDANALAHLAEAVEADDFDIAPILAGQSVGLLRQARPAGEILTELGEGAEQVLRSRVPDLLA